MVVNFDMVSICCFTHAEKIFHLSPGILQHSVCNCLNCRNDLSCKWLMSQIFSAQRKFFIWPQNKNSSGDVQDMWWRDWASPAYLPPGKRVLTSRAVHTVTLKRWGIILLVNKPFSHLNIFHLEKDILYQHVTVYVCEFFVIYIHL